MSRLRTLRARLTRFRRRRRLARWVAAHSALAVAVLWTLWATLAADWLLDMNTAQRLTALLCGLGLVVWAFVRYVRPWLGWRESLIDMALLAQRQQQIDSDLVAALQFESPEAASWGSRQLEEAVIQQVAESGSRVRPVVDIPARLISRRLAAFALTLAATAALLLAFPDHLRTFFDRLLFRPARYPTRTLIESAAINGVAIDLETPGVEIKCPHGLPLRITVACSGRLPASARAELATDQGGIRTAIELEPGVSGSYAGHWPRLVDAATLQIFAGDARTHPIHLLVAPPPSVDVQFEVAPPRYAAGSAAVPEIVSGLRQLSVVEGSRVAFRVQSDKPLREGVATIEGTPQALQRSRESVSASAGGVSSTSGASSPRGKRAADSVELWTLEPSGPPLAEVTEPLRYSIQVVDEDGLSLERPIEGVIRVRPDRPPEVALSALTTLVLPAARPTIAVTASDDYGLAEIVAVAEVIHPDGTPGETMECKLYALPTEGPPKKNVQDRQRLALGPLKAAKGDQVKVTLRATDHRGDRPGKSTTSEPLVFQVTDEQGIYAAMADADRESARRLQTMIEDQIDVGGGK